MLITRSGSSAPRVDSQRCRALAYGVIWTSDRCSTRTGRAPGGRTGTSTRRSRNALTSYKPGVRQAAGADRPDAEQAPDDGCGRTAPRHSQKATSGPAATLVACLMHQALSRSASAQI